MAASCNQKVELGEKLRAPFEQSDLGPNETVVYHLKSAMQIDPVNTAGINLLKHMDIFDDFTFNIYRENSEIVAVEFVENLPFEIFPLPIEGKQEAYMDFDTYPNAIRLKANDQLVATWLTGGFYTEFQLGCKEVSYKLNFK